MKTCHAAVVALTLVACLAGCASLRRTHDVEEAARLHPDGLRRFASAAEFEAWRAARDAWRMRQDHAANAAAARRREQALAECLRQGQDEDNCDSTSIDTIEVTGSRIRRSDIAVDAITNNQEAGVDEGDIVKKAGDFVFVLSQGELYVVRVTERGRPVLALADRIRVGEENEEDDDGVWFDEIIALGDRLLLLGYRYESGVESAELRAFRVATDGHLQRDGVWWLRSSDYFSDTNYGVRLHDGHLLMSLTLPLPDDAGTGMRWPEWSRRDVAAPVWTPLLEATDLYYPVYLAGTPRVHVLLRCPLSGLDGPALDCRASGFIGDADSTLYATPQASWLAISGADPRALARLDGPASRWNGDYYDWLARERRNAVIRLPHDGTPPAFATVAGRITDQFNFDEEGSGLWVATVDEFNGEDEHGYAPTARVRLYRLDAGDLHSRRGDETVPRRDLAFAGEPIQWRFGAAGLWLASQDNDDDYSDEVEAPTRLRLLPRGDGEVVELATVVRPQVLQPIAGRMLSVGHHADGGLGLELFTDATAARSQFLLHVPDRDTAESRSHALNFATLPAGATLIGLPTLPVDTGHDWDHDQPADLDYFALRGAHLAPAGRIELHAQTPPPCHESCYDWYGAARVFFVGDRLFALSGVAMAEGRLGPQGVETLRRLDLAIPE